jgi:large subunit ribosomal protein L9
MKVILNENIESLGRVGDVVEVKAGYARNYLYPRNMAVAPTKHNMEVMKYKKIKAEKQLEVEKMSAREQKVKLEEFKLVIEKKAGETDTLFGSVTTAEIQAKLEELGVSIERKKFHLDEPIKKLGLHVFKIKLVEDIEAEVKIEVLREGGEPEAPAEDISDEDTPDEPVEAAETVDEVEEVEEVDEVEEVEETPAADAVEEDEVEEAEEVEKAEEVEETEETPAEEETETEEEAEEKPQE